MAGRKNLTLDLSVSRVKDTLGHTSTPTFSVDSEFSGHADAFQIFSERKPIKNERNEYLVKWEN